MQFSALVRNEMVQSISCYYEPKRKQFYSVVQLGTDICGYKRIVHGAPLGKILAKSWQASCCNRARNANAGVTNGVSVVPLQVGSQLQCVTRRLAGYCLHSGGLR